MKIAFLMSDLGFSGGSQVIYEYMDRLYLRGHEVYAVTPGTAFLWENGLKEEIKKYYSSNSKILGSFDNSIFADDFSDMISNLCAGRSSDISIFHFAMGKITESIIKKCPSVDFVIATHNFTALAAFYMSDSAMPVYLIQGFEENFYKNILYRKNARMSYYLPMVLISNSTDLKNRIKKYYKRDSVVITPGIDISVFKPRADITDKYLNKKNNKKIIGYYFSPNPIKGYEVFVKALELIKKSGIDFALRVFGSDPGNIFSDFDYKYAGKIFGKELSEFYSSCDVFINTSFEESFPLTLIEAMASGTCVITTDRGNSDYIKDGYNSFVIKKNIPQFVKESYVEFLSDRERVFNYVRNAIKTARKFSWERAVKEFEILLIKIKEGNIYEKESSYN